MTAQLTMFDTAQNDQFPAGAAAYAAYVDGGIADQPNYGYIVSAFPKANHLSIALFPGDDADGLDVETAAAQPGDIPDWAARQVARGITRPVIYANASTMETAVIPVVNTLPGARSSVRLWSAHYGVGEHICGPSSCGATSIDMDGTQWTSTANGLVLDQSLLLDDFFTVPVPADWVFGPVRGLTAEAAGPHSVKLSWSSPEVPMPLGVGHYEITIRHCGQDVATYPRCEAKEANPQEWQGGSLTPGISYEALVRAVATDGGHASEWATVEFTTSN